MKLGQLNAAIRDAPEVKLHSHYLGQDIVVQKGSLIAALRARFDGKAVETGLKLTADGYVEYDQ